MRQGQEEDIMLNGKWLARAGILAVAVGFGLVRSGPAFATAALVQQVTAADSSDCSSSLTATLPANVATGDTLIFTFAAAGTNVNPIINTVSDNNGDSFAPSVQTPSGANTNADDEIWCAQKVAGGPTTVTITLTAGSGSVCGASVNVQEYFGATCTVDQTATASGSSTSPASGTTPTTTNASDLLVAEAGFFHNPALSTGPTNGFTALTSAGNGTGGELFSAFNVVNVTGAYSTGWTIDATDAWEGAIVAFESADFSDTFQTSYYDVATSALTSRAGYGGPGSSGGAGDNTVRIVNPTAANNTSFQGTICAMIYVFDDFEEMQTCCGCPVTPDGLRTLSTVNDLTFDFGVNKGNLNAGTIEIISAQPNFINPNPAPGPNPPGTNGFCSPTGASSSDPFGRSAPIVPVPTLRSYITHDESL